MKVCTPQANPNHPTPFSRPEFPKTAGRDRFRVLYAYHSITFERQVACVYSCFAAQARKVSGAQIPLNCRELARHFKGDFSKRHSSVRILHAQPGSLVSRSEFLVVAQTAPFRAILGVL